MDIRTPAVPPLPPQADVAFLYNAWAPVIAKLLEDNRFLKEQVAALQLAVMGRR